MRARGMEREEIERGKNKIERKDVIGKGRVGAEGEEEE